MCKRCLGVLGSVQEVPGSARECARVLGNMQVRNGTEDSGAVGHKGCGCHTGATWAGEGTW